MSAFRFLPMFAVALSPVLAGVTPAQEAPGLSMGVFLEQRTDVSVGGEDLEASHYGVRVAFETESMIDLHVDFGEQTLSLGDAETDGDGNYGLGGTLWMMRATDDVSPIDFGIHVSYHVSDATFTSPAADARYSYLKVQASVRPATTGSVQPFLMVGAMQAKLEPDNAGAMEAVEEWKPAIDVGVDILLVDQVSLKLSANFAESIGATGSLAYRF